MITLARLLIFPVLALALLTAAWRSSHDALRLVRHGQRTPGVVCGMLREQDDSATLVYHLTTSISWEFGTGARATLQTRDGVPTAALLVHAGVTQELSAAAVQTMLNDTAGATGQTCAAALAAARRLVTTDFAGMQRLLMNWRATPAAPPPVLLEKTEIAEVISAITGTLHAISQLPDGTPRVATSFGVFDRASQTQLFTRAVLRATPGAAPQSEFTRTIGAAGAPAPCIGFLLQDATQHIWFRPVYSYAVAGRTVLLPAPLMRRNEPPTAFALFTPVMVLYEPAHATRSLLLPDVASQADAHALHRFNAVAEAVFTCWYLPGLLAVGGVLCVLIGLLMLSLVVLPASMPRVALS